MYFLNEPHQAYLFCFEFDWILIVQQHSQTTNNDDNCWFWYGSWYLQRKKGSFELQVMAKSLCCSYMDDPWVLPLCFKIWQILCGPFMLQVIWVTFGASFVLHTMWRIFVSFLCASRDVRSLCASADGWPLCLLLSPFCVALHGSVLHAYIPLLFVTRAISNSLCVWASVSAFWSQCASPSSWSLCLVLYQWPLFMLCASIKLLIFVFLSARDHRSICVFLASFKINRRSLSNVFPLCFQSYTQTFILACFVWVVFVLRMSGL